ncbi:MAG: universal stress protein [Chitinispirillaceae bacterium]|nr:universal stress protein [Chitinispirillaceae bacterium]
MSEESSSDNQPSQTAASLCVLLALHDNRFAKMSFVHALRLAYAAKGELEIVDVRPVSERMESIGVREYLEKWGILSAESKRSDVASTGLRVKKLIKKGNQRRVLRKRLKCHPHDLLVVGTQSSGSHGGLFGKSLAAYLANYFRHTTLFIPSGARPFIDEATGDVALKRVLMPVESDFFFIPAMRHLERLLSFFPDVAIEVIALHAGGAFPKLPPCQHPRIIWREELRDQPVVEAIVMVAENFRCDLVVMSTNGRDTLAQKIIGSNTEQVLRAVSCPVVSVSVQR